MPSQWYGILAAVFSVGVQLVLFLRWLHRRMRNDEIVRAFIRDIATNHLPHIYNALHKIAARQRITRDETPLVRFAKTHYCRGCNENSWRINGRLPFLYTNRL